MPSANVRSIEAVEQFQATLIAYAEDLGQNLDELAGCVRRIERTFSDDYPAYWRRQIEAADREAKQADLSLSRLLSTPRGGDQPAAIEAKQRVAATKRRLRHCHQRLATSRRRALSISQALDKLLGPIASMRTSAEGDLPAAAHQLRHTIDQLRRYADP